MGIRNVEPVMTRFAALCFGLVVLAACGSEPLPSSQSPERTAEPGNEEQKYRETGLVLHEPEREAKLCLSSVIQTLPPQCGGLPLVDWDWDDVTGEESRGGATWGTYEVTGYYDGETFTVSEAGPPPESGSNDHDSIESACEEPPDGWEIPDPKEASASDREHTINKAEDEPDFVGAWIDYEGQPTEFHRSQEILSLAFTGDLDEHDTDARKTWGGPLCIAQFEQTYARLREIQGEFTDPNDFGLDILSSDIDVTRNIVLIEVVVVAPATREKVDERYGEGTVKVQAQLQPV